MREMYDWIWHREDLSKEPPVVRLMNKKDRLRRIWLLTKSKEEFIN